MHDPPTASYYRITFCLGQNVSSILNFAFCILHSFFPYRKRKETILMSTEINKDRVILEATDVVRQYTQS
ncbi:MAG: hypothetical protein IJ363_01530, partial [Clostridia bacterium]|nr:hypothetical protein [Clostridia bacterium]